MLKLQSSLCAVLRRGKIVLQKSYGFANVERFFSLASTNSTADGFALLIDLLEVITGNLDEQLFTDDARAGIGKELQQSLNAFSFPVAIIHSSELVEQRTEGNMRVYCYLLTDRQTCRRLIEEFDSPLRLCVFFAPLREQISHTSPTP